MQWDLGLQGSTLLGATSLGLGAVAGMLVGEVWVRRSGFGVGLLASKAPFGRATRDDLEPDSDGLSRDEALLSSLLTTALIVLVMRYLARRSQGQTTGTCSAGIARITARSDRRVRGDGS